MRICLISFEYLPRTGFGGAAALYTDLATALARFGHEVTVLAGNNTSGTTTDHVNGIDVFCFGQRRLRPRPLACVERSFRVLWRFHDMLDTRKPFDVVESPELAAEPLLLNAIMKTSPTVTRLVTPHYLLHRMNGKRRIRSVDWMERKNAELSDVIVGDSKAWAEGILEDWGIDRSKLRICPLGIDLTRIDRAESVPVPVDGPYVLFAGRLTLAKGPQILAAAVPAILREHPEVRIVFAGGDTRTESGESVREIAMSKVPPEMRKSIIFLGFVNSWDLLVSLYRNASVSIKADVYTNHSYDTLGQLACSRPMVCSRTGAHIEMIRDGENGFLFDRNDPASVAEIVNRLLSDQGLRERIGRKARETVERRYTSSAFAARTLDIYDEITG